MILAGDIGGTSTRLAAFEFLDGGSKLVVERVFPSPKFSGLGEILDEFMAAHALRPEFACFGIAGPVREGRVVTPNLPWVVDAAALAGGTGIAAVALINDLEANAWGIAELGADDFLSLNPDGAAVQGNAAVVAAGTGLGEAGLYFDGERHRPFACEGGHVDFAPRDAAEIELLRYLVRKYGRVSYERVVSGPGLRNVYDFLRDSGRGEESLSVAAEMRERDAAAVIAESALAGRCALCAAALDLFVSIYGAEAGNAALKFLAVGGVYLGGGIPPKIAPKLQDGTFLRSFVAKGRMQPLLEAMPVRIILNPKTALLGAMRYAGMHSGQRH